MNDKSKLKVLRLSSFCQIQGTLTFAAIVSSQTERAAVQLNHACP